jgi:serine/threonine-protein kinase RsbT
VPLNGSVVSISSDRDIVTARQRGRELAISLGLSVGEATLIATAISELARNIVTYARNGEIALSVSHSQNRVGLTVMARDAGPGIADIEQALRDGFSTSGSFGLGLPGVRRLMDEFDIQSGPNGGTVVTVTKWRA